MTFLMEISLTLFIYKRRLVELSSPLPLVVHESDSVNLRHHRYFLRKPSYCFE